MIRTDRKRGCGSSSSFLQRASRMALESLENRLMLCVNHPGQELAFAPAAGAHLAYAPAAGATAIEAAGGDVGAAGIAPIVTSMTINEGAEQRSMVRTISLTFSQNVNVSGSLAPQTLLLWNHTT